MAIRCNLKLYKLKKYAPREVEKEQLKRMRLRMPPRAIYQICVKYDNQEKWHIEKKNALIKFHVYYIHFFLIYPKFKTTGY